MCIPKIKGDEVSPIGTSISAVLFNLIAFFKDVKRLNILYTYSTDKLHENELYSHISNWAINNAIDVLWAINRSTELKNIFPPIFSKTLKFASWSSDEKILEILQHGLLDLQGIDTDTDSCLYVDDS